MTGIVGMLVLALSGCAFAPEAAKSPSAAGSPTSVASTLSSAPLPTPPVTLDPAEIAQRYEAGLALFSYDVVAPLDVEQGARPFLADEAFSAYSLTYASPTGGRVPATLLVPSGTGPHPAMLAMHGLGDTMASEMFLAQRYARAGAVVLLIDAPFARPGRREEPPLSFTPRDRGEHIQLIVDLRRAIDLLLQRPDVDAERIAYHGFSYGATIGGLLAGVEERIAAYALVVGDGGLVQHFTGIDDRGGPLDEMPVNEREAWLAVMEPLESIYFVGHAAPAALLFQSGRNDDLVPQADAERFQDAGSEPKTILWYDSGHQLPPEAECDAAAWLAELIAIDPGGYSSDCAG
jgi:hypothetical protein